MFAGGFDLDAAVAIAGEGLDEYAVLDLVEALVRKSLVDADRLFGRTRYVLLETIRQFAEEQLAETADIAGIRALHARYYARRAAEVLMWFADGERQREMYEWQIRELANLRAGFRAAADAGDLDSAASIAVSATAILPQLLERLEPSGWAEELLDAAGAADHPQLAALYAAASICAATGRTDDGFEYVERARVLFADSRYVPIPFGIATSLAAWPYLHSGRIDSWIELCRAEIARVGVDTVYPQVLMVVALAFGRRYDEATALAAGVVETAEASGNPTVLFSALCAYFTANFDRDPPAALGALSRALSLARETGLGDAGATAMLARAEAANGDPRHALDACREALVAYAASGDLAAARTPLSVLACLLHRMGNDEPAAVLAGCGDSPVIAGYPEVVASIEHLREALGADAFEALAERGRAMETTAKFRYALEQIEESRDEIGDRA